MTRCDLVSVVIPSYNHQAFVEQAIQSVWIQTHKHIELIVVDDCSTDNTYQVALSLLGSSPISMKVLRNSRNKGITGTLNHGLEHVKGEWVSILASDDWYASNKIERQLEEAEKRGEAYGCIHSDSYLVTHDGKVAGTVYENSTLPPMTGEALLDLAYGRANMVAISALIRSSLLRTIGGVDSTLRAEDFDLHLSLAKLTRYAFVSEPLTYSRIVEGSLGKSPEKYLSELIVVLEKHREDFSDDFNEIMRTRALHGVNIAAAHQFWEGMMTMIDLGVDYSQSRTDVANFVLKSSVVISSLMARKHLAEKTTPQIRRLLSQAYQSWLYKGF